MIAEIKGYLYAAAALVLVGLGLALWLQTARLDAAVSARRLAENERAAIAADLATSKRNADRMMAEKQDAIDALVANSINDAATSSRLTDTLLGINNAPNGKACASSAPVRAVFDSLRKQKATGGN